MWLLLEGKKCSKDAVVAGEQNVATGIV